MPLTNTAGWLGRRAAEMPSRAAVAVSISATCWPVSFSYVLSGEPAAIDSPIARTAPGDAASRLTVWELAADSAGELVTPVPWGRATGHQTPAATTPWMWPATVSASAGNPMAGLVPGGATLLAGPLSSTVTVVSSRIVNWCEIWPAPVAVRPSTATNAPTPRTVPSMVSPDRPGRCTIPATASAAASRTVSRGDGRPGPGLGMTRADPLSQHSVADRHGPGRVGRYVRVVGDDHDGEAAGVELVEQFHERGGVTRVQVPRRLVAQQQARPVDQGPRDRDPLAFSAGQRGGERLEPMPKPDGAERVDRSLEPDTSRCLVVQLGEQHVLQRRPVGQQVEGLEDDPDPPAAQRRPIPVVQRARVQAVKQVAAGRGGVEQPEQVQQRGLARARRTGHRDVIVRLDNQVGRAQRMDR